MLRANIFVDLAIVLYISPETPIQTFTMDSVIDAEGITR